MSDLDSESVTSLRQCILWCIVSVWADDQWLVEHAGATLNNTDDADAGNDEADSAAEKQTEESVETVSSLIY